MKLIIDIPNDVYEHIKSTKTIETVDYDIVSLYRATKNGTPVSSDGDLISREALKKEVENLVVGGAEGLKDYYENGSKSDENAWIGGIYDAWELIDNMQTVEPTYQMPKDYIKNKLDYSRPQGCKKHCNTCVHYQQMTKLQELGYCETKNYHVSADSDKCINYEEKQQGFNG